MFIHVCSPFYRADFLSTAIERLPVSLILILSLRGRERKEKRPNQSIFHTVKIGISALADECDKIPTIIHKLFTNST